MSVKERLIKFVEYKKMSKSAFCRSIGVSSAFISSMVKSIQPDKVQRITLEYPELNTGWLLTGAGEMLNKEADITIHGGTNVLSEKIEDTQIGDHNVKHGLFSGKQRIQELEGENELLRKEIELLKKTIEQKDKMIDALLNK